MALTLQNFSTMVQNMVAATQGACKKLLNLTSGSTLLAAIQAGASQGLWLQFIALIVLQRTRLATSTGPDVDSWGADFGFMRLPATNATGSVTFTRFVAASSALVPVGAQVRTADGTQTFTVIADATNALWNGSNGFIIPVGTLSAPIKVQAVNAGTQGNVLANTITLPVGGISGIDTVNNPVTFSNGVNSESDGAFRLRFQLFVETRAEGTDAALLYAAENVQSGITATVVHGAPGSGDTTVYIDDGTGAPSSGLINRVMSAVTAVAASGINTYVMGPALITANVSAELLVSTGASLSAADTAAQAAVQIYIDGLPMGAGLSYTRLASIIYGASSSITNISNLLLNGGTADIGGMATQVVRSGTVALS